MSISWIYIVSTIVLQESYLRWLSQWRRLFPNLFFFLENCYYYYYWCRQQDTTLQVEKGRIEGWAVLKSPTFASIISHPCRSLTVNISSLLAACFCYRRFFSKLLALTRFVAVFAKANENRVELAAKKHASQQALSEDRLEHFSAVQAFAHQFLIGR